MKKARLWVILFFLVIISPKTANAIPFQFDLGAGSYFDGSAFSDPGLVLFWEPVNLDSLLFTLDQGDNYTFLVAEIGTAEGWVNEDDLIPRDINFHLDFDNPDLIPPTSTGTSVGFVGYWWIIPISQGWKVEWNSPTTVNFGNGGQFTIELNDLFFEAPYLAGPDGASCSPHTEKLFATITLNSSPVPEPASALFLGCALLAISMLRRKI